MDVIKTERLKLIPIELNHAALLLPIWSDEDVVKNTYIHSIHTVSDCEGRIKRILNIGPSRKEYVIFYGDIAVGVMGVSRESSFEYGIYYHLARNYWGQGFATEVAKTIIDDIFTLPGVVRISADTLTTNKASSRVLEKVGMRFEGCLRMKFHRNGVFGDLNTYSILRSEYQCK